VSILFLSAAFKQLFIPFTPARMKSMNNSEEYVIIMAKILDLTIPDRYLGSAEKVCWWGQGVGCGVWGVGFYRF
jgi:hypothetical protein